MTDQAEDPRVAVALAALAEITDPADIGDLVDATEIGPGVIDLHFSTTMPGYVDWRWTVSTAVVDDASAPTVLEVQLLPGEGSLLAPPWVPWTERLAEWRRSHPDEDAEGIDDDESDDDPDGDESDVDDDGSDDDDESDDDEDVVDEDPFEAAGVDVEDVVVEETDDDDDDDDDDLYGDSGEDDPATDAAPVGDDSGDDDTDDDDDADDEGFRPPRGADRF